MEASQSTDSDHQRGYMTQEALLLAIVTQKLAQQEHGIPVKPRFRAQCNHCGLCCLAALCPAAQAVNPLAQAPCEHLTLEGNKALCGLVLEERENGRLPVLRLGLGIGTGCSMGDDDTTDAELTGFDDEISKLLRPEVLRVLDAAEREGDHRIKRLQNVQYNRS